MFLMSYVDLNGFEFWRHFSWGTVYIRNTRASCRLLLKSSSKLFNQDNLCAILNLMHKRESKDVSLLNKQVLSCDQVTASCRRRVVAPCIATELTVDNRSDKNRSRGAPAGRLRADNYD